jgi:hypothetical protein
MYFFEYNKKNQRFVAAGLLVAGLGYFLNSP